MYEIARPGTGYGSSTRRYFGDGVCKESRVLNEPGLCQRIRIEIARMGRLRKTEFKAR